MTKTFNKISTLHPRSRDLYLHEAAELNTPEQFATRLAHGAHDSSARERALLAATRRRRWRDIAGSEIALQLLVVGTDPNCISENGAQPLHHAASSGDVALCEQLLAHGASIAGRTEPAGSSALHEAAWNGRLEVCRRFLDEPEGHGLIDDDSRSPSPLWMAARMGHIDVCELLIEAGADIEKPGTPHGPRPLMDAVISGQRDLVVSLVEAGAALDARDHLGRNALTAALMRPDIALVLLAAGISPHYSHHNADPDPVVADLLDIASSAHGRLQLRTLRNDVDIGERDAVIAAVRRLRRDSPTSSPA